MGKSDFLSPKAIANRIKSKGLQKLRWYCQMCQKQCRDENGFKCHCMSESHQRQLLLASENPQQFMDYFSEEFRNDFLELLRRRFGTKRVHNNIVYNEYISHREHIHMNATQWETLTDFTKWLGREGLCKVDETPKGWYIQYIDRDPETIRRQQEQERKKKQDLDDEEKTAKFIEQQVRRGLEGKELEKPVYTELNRESEEEKVTFNLNKGASTSIAASSKTSVLGPNALKMVEGAVKRKESAHSSGQSKEKKKKSALDEIMEVIIMQDLCLYNPVPMAMTTLPGRPFEVTSDLQFMWNSDFYQAKLFHFLIKTGFCCSSVPIPQTTEMLEVKEYRFWKRRKYLETLDKNKYKSSFYNGFLDLIRLIFMQQAHTDLPYLVLGFFLFPTSCGPGELVQLFKGMGKLQ
ncbi:DNA/RNA-binding protein KIN17 isoform X2 [Calonectris borealis]|uniref:DNA/RNA-binding protein KIN17 isoform X2 n=1 Tax=Calonectris borealis TaxID=1323832 RepID=UPI003F4BC8B1